MSTCISSAGEYSAHEPGDWCPRCGEFNERAIVAERDRLRQQVSAVWHQGWKAGWDDHGRAATDRAAYVRSGSTPNPYPRPEPGGSDRG